MGAEMDRRDFVRKSAVTGVAVTTPGLLRLAGDADTGATPAESGDAAAGPGVRGSPAVHAPASVAPAVISDRTGYDYRAENGENAVERAFRRITEGDDVLDALIAGVNIPELDPEETGVGYGGVPNADGVVQLDACCMHGPRGWAGGVAGIEGVKTPSLVARAVATQTDHHLLVGDGAREFARVQGMEIHDSLNTENSLRIWREWKRRIDPGHWLDPEARRNASAAALRRFRDAGRRAALAMVREGRIPSHGYWGTISCEGISPSGEICGVTTTSGLWFKIPGRVGDSPILGAGQYVDNAAGAAGSTGRGEANLHNLSTFLIVEQLRQGMHPKDAGMTALRRIREATREERLLNRRGLPAFDVRFFVLDREGRYAGVALYGADESEYAVCTESGAELRPLEGLLDGSPTD